MTLSDNKIPYVYVIEKWEEDAELTEEIEIVEVFKHKNDAIDYVNQQIGFNNIPINWDKHKSAKSEKGISYEFLDNWRIYIMPLRTKKLDIKGQKVKKLLNRLNLEEQQLLEEYYKGKITRVDCPY